MITIVSDEDKVGEVLYRRLQGKAEEVHYHNIQDKKISTCLGCDYCLTKSYLECTIKDDMQDLYSDLLMSNTLILTTPVCFGSYSAQIKKMLDRMVVLGDARYGFNGKEITAMFLNKKQKVLVLAIDALENDKTTMLHLVNENKIITQNNYRLYFVSSHYDGIQLLEVIEYESPDYFGKS